MFRSNHWDYIWEHELVRREIAIMRLPLKNERGKYGGGDTGSKYAQSQKVRCMLKAVEAGACTYLHELRSRLLRLVYART